MSSITARNGIATTANCFSSTAPASAAAAQRARPRVASAKARIISVIEGASFWPNQAERTAIGLATITAPMTSRHSSGARKASAAASPPSVNSSTSIR